MTEIASVPASERLITHLRHVDLAVPDYDKQLEFYTDMWGLKPETTEDGLAFLAAEGSPGAVRRTPAQGRREAPRPDLLRRRQHRRRRRHGRATRHRRRPARHRARQAPDPRRRLRLPLLRQRRPHRRGLLRRRRAPAPQDRGRRVDPGQALPRRHQLAEPRGHRRLLPTPPRLRALRHPDAPAHGRDDVVPADQLVPPQPRDRPRPARRAAPRLVRDARHRRVHARHRAPAARRRREGLGTRTPHGRQQHLQLLPRPARQHRRVHDRARDSSTRTAGTRTSTTSPTRWSPTSGAPRTR